MFDLTSSNEIEQFNIKKQFQHLLKQHLEIQKLYDELIICLNAIPYDTFDSNNSKLSLSEIFNRIKDIYLPNIEDKKSSIKIIEKDFEQFNELYSLEEELLNFHSKKEELINQCHNFISKYDIKKEI